MEEDFLDLGFVDSSILKGIPEAKEEPTNPPETEEEKKKETPSEAEPTEKEIKREENKEVKNPTETEAQGSPNLSSSIAKALVDDGVLQTLSEEQIAKITDAESLIEALKEDQRNQLDERQKRIDDALNYGVEPTRIQQYEQWINTLDQVTDEILEGEGTQNENYRKNLIYNNYVVKGFDKDEALEMTNRSIESGNDINDAKKALSSLKKYYQDAYSTEVADAKKQYETQVEAQKKQIKDLRDSILNDDDFYNQFEMSKNIRQKVFDVVAKASIQDGDKKITPMQKYIKDDPNRANKIIGTLYVLTEGFTKFDNIMKGTVKKQVRESVKNLERALNQTKPMDGSMNFKTGLAEDNSNLKLLDFDLED